MSPSMASVAAAPMASTFTASTVSMMLRWGTRSATTPPMEMAPIMVQAAVIALATIPFGFSVHPLGMLIGLALIAIFGMGYGALRYALAMPSNNRDWMFWAVQQATIFQLLILSGMLLPLDDGPGWMQVAASLNPITYVVSAERALFAGDVGSVDVVWGFVAAIALAAVGLAVGIRSIRRSS